MFPLLFRILRFLLIAGLVIGVCLWIYSSLTFDRSFKGFVNGKVVHVRPPIKGKLHLVELSLGTPVLAHQSLGSIENDRAYELLSYQQDLQTKANVAGQTMASLDSLIANRKGWLGKLSTESTDQSGLRLDYLKQSLAASQAEVDQARVSYEKASADADRYVRLMEKGFAPRTEAEKYAVAAQSAENALKTTEAKLAAEQAKVAAAGKGLQLDGSMTRSYSDMRQYDVETDIVKLRNERQHAAAEAMAARAQLASLQKPLEQVKEAPLKAPVNGVVWNLNYFNDEYVNGQETVMEILDCDHLWVDTYIPEKDLTNINLQKPVRLRLLSHPELGDLKGDIQFVRSGVGKVIVMEGVALPSEEQKSHALIRVKVDWPGKPDMASSCSVGTSVQAEFAQRSFNLKDWVLLMIHSVPL
jgi:multidrug resistance efflux pump